MSGGPSISKHFMFTVNEELEKRNEVKNAISKHFMFTVNRRIK